jgi:hypothetical protein
MNREKENGAGTHRWEAPTAKALLAELDDISRGEIQAMS